MRGFFEAVLVRDEDNRIIFRGPAGSTATISISADGNIDIDGTKADIKDRTKRTVTAELKNGDTLSFSMAPSQARLYISGDIDGVKLKPSDILYGSSAIAINNTLEIMPEDRKYYKGLPESFTEDKAPVLLFGIFEKDNVTQENLKNSPKQLKSMLEQWGYIN
jgi:hypothetical protein